MRCEHFDELKHDLKGLIGEGISICEVDCPYGLRSGFNFPGEEYQYPYCSTDGEIPEEKSKLVKAIQPSNQPSASP